MNQSELQDYLTAVNHMMMNKLISYSTGSRLCQNAIYPIPAEIKSRLHIPLDPMRFDYHTFFV